MLEISEKEVLRYLGYGGVDADEHILAHVRELYAEIAVRVKPKSAHGLWPLSVSAPYVSLGSKRSGITVFTSADLSRHLERCTYAVLFSATLGAEADALLARYAVSDMEKALVADAICTELLEAFCDEAVAKLSKTERLLALSPTTRYSPGYGDFPLTYQRDFLRLLDCAKRIGLTLTDALMLSPSKSVTAIVGFGAGVGDGGGCSRGKCEECCNFNCQFRR